MRGSILTRILKLVMENVRNMKVKWAVFFIRKIYRISTRSLDGKTIKMVTISVLFRYTVLILIDRLRVEGK